MFLNTKIGHKKWSLKFYTFYRLIVGETQTEFICSNLTIETLQQGVKNI